MSEVATEAASSASFHELRVAAFESRKSDETAQLIRNFQGQPFVSPSMREVPLAENPRAIEFGKELVTGGLDVVVFLTGVGFEHLLAFLERHFARERLLDALRDIVTIARGPKPVAAMKKVGLVPTHVVPEPNTWRELLQTLDLAFPVTNLNVAVQEYGQPSPGLTAGLEARGATLRAVPVYTWELPIDVEPLRTNVAAVASGQRDVLMFTSAHQVVNVNRVAEELGVRGALESILPEVVVASIGPTTSEALRHHGWPIDFVPSRSKLGIFVRELAIHARDLKRRKRRILTRLNEPPTDPLDLQAPWQDSPFLRACRREPNAATPIWLMRQAGRYLPEYRAIRAKLSFLELCKRPDACAEIMITTVQRLGVDAAIIFSDLLPILEPMGMQLEFAAGEGPVIHNPVREAAEVDRVQELTELDALDFVFETVRLTRAALDPRIPLIGFAGAPFTLASYAIEGGASRNFLHTKTLMYRDEPAWRELMSRLSRSIARYLNAQIRAGAQCVQIFDSWVGCLAPPDYRQFVLPHMVDLLRRLAPGVPVISFATGNPALLPLLAEAHPDVVGVDWRIELKQADALIGRNRAIQGNLDPCVLLGDPAEIGRRAREILSEMAGRPGHIFNLGHGVLPQTPVDHVLRLVDAVHQFRP